ncbi:MAG: hypothetical protein ACKVVP_17855 [Chloroflexota bacterium]
MRVIVIPKGGVSSLAYDFFRFVKRPQPGQEWLDLRAIETREALRAELAKLLVELGLPDLDLSTVLGPWRRLTQAVARWASDHGYAGVVYASRLDARLHCSAVFEGARFIAKDAPEPVPPDDVDLVRALQVLGVALSE